MYLWMPVIAISVVKVVCALIDWRARVAYERARAAAVVEILRAAPRPLGSRTSVRTEPYWKSRFLLR